MARIRNYFLTGLLVTMPLFIAATLGWWLIQQIDSRIVPLIPARYNPNSYLQDYGITSLGIPGLGVIFLFIIITAIGFFTASLAGRWLVGWGDRIVNSMPFFGTVYSGSKQILETVLQDKSQAFREAVLIQYPREGLWAIAFVTGTSRGEIAAKLSEDMVNVFLPTTPNPTSGFLLMVRRDDVIPLDMGIEHAIKLVISAGLIAPGEAPRLPQ